MDNTVIAGIVIAIILACSSASSASVAFATKLPESSFQKQLLKIRGNLPTTILERLPQDENISVDTEPGDEGGEKPTSPGSVSTLMFSSCGRRKHQCRH